MALILSIRRSKALSYLVNGKARNETRAAGFLELNSSHTTLLLQGGRHGYPFMSADPGNTAVLFNHCNSWTV